MTANTPKGMVEGDLNETLFRKIVKNISDNAEYINHEEIPFSNETGYNTRKGSESNDHNARVTGLRAYAVRYRIMVNQNSTEKNNEYCYQGQTSRSSAVAYHS